MKYQIVRAFSKNGKGGNPAAVVINQTLSPEEKQEVAAQIGFSETAFLQYNNSKLHIDFFTPNKPIAYCGHATIAAVNILRQQNLIDNGHYILQTNENPIPVIINDAMVYMQQAYPVFEEINIDEVAALLKTTKDNIAAASLARNGVGYLLIELKDDNLLYYLEPDEQLVYDYSAKHDLIGIYPFVKNEEKILSRMFAPYYEIKEENATGMAGGLLGGWLHYLSNGKINRLFIEQGHSVTMKEKGYLQVRIENDIKQFVVEVGGEAVVKEMVELSLVQK